MLLLNRLPLFLLLIFFLPSQLFSQTPKQQVQNWNTRQQSRFTENKGQVTDQNGNLRNDVKYIYAAPGFKAIFKANSFSYEVFTVEKDPKQQEISEATGKSVNENNLVGKFKKPEDITIKTSRIDIELAGANKHPQIIAEGKSSDYNNYYLAHTPEEGIQKVYNYKKLTYKNIWPNIDLVFYARKEGELKYDIVVHPGGKLSDVKFAYKDADRINLKNGKLQISSASGKIEEHIPNSYLSENKEKVSVCYKLKENSVTFTGKYEKNKTLIIDPILIWATYNGGNGDEFGMALCKGTNGYLYQAGCINYICEHGFK